MDEIEKQRILKELTQLNKEFLDYKKRQERHVKIKFNEGQMKKLDELRIRAGRRFRWLKDAISKYGGDASIKVAGININAFEYSLKPQSVHIIPELFTSLDIAINTVNKAIREIEAITVGTMDWRDISISKQQKERAKETIPISCALQLHPKVIAASKSLFETGHYSQAIFEAFKTVNNFVKEKTGLSLDGRELMAKVFREQSPLIKLNELRTQSDRDEQEGFKFLFMGAMVGIRNPKAHDNVIQTDPYRTLEYLAFASLLMKRAEEGELTKLQKNA